VSPDEKTLLNTPLLVIAGPTGVGKTALSLALAERLNGEIVSADSMQVYRGMDIGTAKATAAERARVPHHLIDVCEPTEPFDVAVYTELAEAAVRDIQSRGKLPIVVGGTGFYIQALLKGLDFSEGAQDPVFREEMNRLADEVGNEALHRLLEKADPAAAAAIHPNNRKRVIRAMEYFRETGRRLSETNEEQKGQAPKHPALLIVLTLPREELYRRIDRRVDGMLAAGLREEVAALQERGCRRGMVSMQALGYKEILDELDGLLTPEEAEAKIRQESRRYAKRQLTWFRREKSAVWLDKSQFGSEEELTEETVRLWVTFQKNPV